MSYEISEIISRQDLEKAVQFIHANNFSLNTTENKISFNKDNRILGLLIKQNEQIVGSIFYYYQPNFRYKNQTYKVINFATIYVLESHRGKGISKLMLNKTLEVFKDYIITDYTPVGSIMHIIKKLNFGFMKNNRSLIFPLPLINFFSKFNYFGELNRINDTKEINEIFKDFEQYRHYEIDLWKYEFEKDNLIIGVINREHSKKFGFLNIKLKSKRVLWTNNEELLCKYANNISFKFAKKEKTHFITIDVQSKKRPFFSLKLMNQFMMYPNLGTKVPTDGSEFFANNL